jgi:AcrR family transcriptional regulator
VVTEPATDKGRATRQAILAAAEAVFGEGSYDGASVAEITRRAGVAQGTFYLYFPDKKAAFIELARQLNHDLRRAIAMAVDGIEDRLERERIGFATFFEYVSRHVPLYRIVREAEVVAPDVYRWHYRTLADGYVAGLEQAQEAGQITADISADTIAWILMGIAELVGSRWLLFNERVPPPEVLEEVMEFVSRALQPRGAVS